MKYRTFSGYHKGYSHVKNDKDCEDYAMSYSDPEGRYYICAACDGHSDNNCFRSAKGAQYGCESAVEVLRRFFDLYYEEEEKQSFSKETEDRLRRSIKQCWENKVEKDITDYPLTPEELAPLSERVQKIYESKRGLNNIYGATFLAAAICEDFFVALHIGDGILLCVDSEGKYEEPLAEDPKSETGAPASLCDKDLFSREEAFRIKFSTEIPQAVVVSSDGIGDCMDMLQFREFFRDLAEKFESMGEHGSGLAELNERQKSYLGSCLKYWGDKGHGAEDDCSLAGIYDYSRSIPAVRIPLELAQKLWEDTVSERNNTIRDYDKRKMDIVKNMERKQGESLEIVQKTNLSREWNSMKEKIEELKQILQNIERNEQEKVRYLDKKLEICGEYLRREGSVPQKGHLMQPQAIDKKYTEEDKQFVRAKMLQNDYYEMKEMYEAAERAASKAEQEYEAAEENAKKAKHNYEAAKEEAQKTKEENQAASSQKEEVLGEENGTANYAAEGEKKQKLPEGQRELEGIESRKEDGILEIFGKELEEAERIVQRAEKELESARSAAVKAKGEYQTAELKLKNICSDIIKQDSAKWKK